jgi:hypothetical protein
LREKAGAALQPPSDLISPHVRLSNRTARIHIQLRSENDEQLIARMTGKKVKIGESMLIPVPMGEREEYERRNE